MLRLAAVRRAPAAVVMRSAGASSTDSAAMRAPVVRLEPSPRVVTELSAQSSLEDAACFGLWAATKYSSSGLLTSEQMLHLAWRCISESLQGSHPRAVELYRNANDPREVQVAAKRRVGELMAASLVHHVSLAGVVCFPVLPTGIGLLGERSVLDKHIGALDSQLQLANLPLMRLWRRAAGLRSRQSPPLRRILTEQFLVGSPRPPKHSTTHFWHALFEERLWCPCPIHRLEAVCGSNEFFHFSGGFDFETRLRTDCVSPLATSAEAAITRRRMERISPLAHQRRRCVFMDPSLLAPYLRPSRVLELAPCVFFSGSEQVFETQVFAAAEEERALGKSLSVRSLSFLCGWQHEYGALWGTTLMRRYLACFPERVRVTATDDVIVVK